MKEWIARGLAQMGLTPPPAAVEQLEQYALLMLEQNKVMNLTAITDPQQVVSLHLLDSAAVLTYENLARKSLIDVGTGAGFPGLVLKVLEPSLKLTLLDGQQKRLDWLAAVCKELGLVGISFVHGRAEEESLKPTHREQYDVATARAVAPMNVLCEMCLPYVKVGGHFLAMKSVGSDEELAQASHSIQLLGGKAAGQADYPVPLTDVVHRIISVEKNGPTPTGYPRRWAKVQKSPL